VNADGGPARPDRTRPDRARAWLEIMRISNLPTVVSNAIAGAAVGTVAHVVEDPPGFVAWIGQIVYRFDAAAPSIGLVLALLAAPPLAYLGGMVLNDAFDASVDARERPARPIPSGRIARAHAFAVGFLLLGAAIAASAAADVVPFLATLLLCAAIVVYDRFHTKSVASTLLLALCRALASLIPMLGCADGDLMMLARRGALVLPLALAAWTLGLSLVARSEMRFIARRAHARTAPSPCPKCGQLMHRDAATCAECGRASEHEWRRESAELRWHGVVGMLAGIPAAGALLVFLSLLHGFTTVMRDGRPATNPIETLPVLGAGLAAVCIVVATRAHSRMRRDPTRIPSTIGTWIACLALIDAMAVAIAGSWAIAACCTVLFALTLRLQRRIAGS